MSTKLYVGNLSYESSEEDLRELFARDGRTVDSVNIITDRESGRPRGFAFVEMASADDATAAISALDGQELLGRALRVSEARERRPRGEGGGGGGGGGGGYGGSRRRRY
jgi:RNA recognition motif-containing protein